ncbi:metabotropic glutamate receptor 1-like [Mizuhopecten yessoensis]|uniref:Metabotropic glutamate receptor 1 n=1 Tax=Mizuhopecten yessoensis TaxID=6573 RepID=A0A210QJG2_MIZYE|nr:metabotropic glutamate receptor 1-like [Mizuhopecten yessoensis]OWF48826.1 Metabotropic glutamate receptor 1 [Mizuhopecten yessoensis]
MYACAILWILFHCVLCEDESLAAPLKAGLGARRIARKEGDVIFGALLPMHKKPPETTVYTRSCGKIWEQYGIHRLEIFLETVDKINASPDILPNVTVGYDIRDSCWYSPIALEQSIDFIKDSLANLDAEEARQNNSTPKGDCKTENRKPIVGLIGPGSSHNTIQVQNLLQIFHIPQIGFSATSMELSNKNLYGYFLRVVPSDKYQAQAMLDIVIRYNWTYISTVHTDGNYGARGLAEFHNLARNSSVCIANTESAPSRKDPHVFDALIRRMLVTKNARVIVCFCEGATVTSLYNATRRVKGAQGHFLILGSDGWADRPDVVESIEDAAAGGLSMKLHSPIIPAFDKKFKALNPFLNDRNPWFKEFWQEKFSCTIPGDEDAKAEFINKTCTGREIHQDFVQDSKLGFVVNAMYTMAKALHNMHQDICGDYPGLCPEMIPLEGRKYKEYLLNVSMVTYSNDDLHFDKNGDPPARYDIMNFQKFGEGANVTYGYVKVGEWNTGHLDMNDSKIYWLNRLSGEAHTMSVCSQPCSIGNIKNIEGNTRCCWTCIPCEENEFMMDEETCKSCSKGWWPNEDLTACKMIETEYLSWFDTEAVVAISLACFGIFVTLWITVIFIRHHNTPVVKASTRELSYIIMFGIITAFCCNFVLVSKPTIVSCYFTRILPGLSFSLIYGALVTKTNRIARILEGTKKIITKKPRFMSASAQVIITCIIVGIECAIITVMLIIEPADSKLDYPTNKRVRLVCNTTTLGIVVPFGFDLVLILMCTLYAVKTRNLPENFNEAKFIGFTMYTTCVIWLGFFAIYFGSEARVLTMSVSISLSASVSLVLLFFPKIYVIVWAPEKNTRSAFTTSKDVRCHIGSISFHSAESVDMMRDKKTMDGKNAYRRRSVFGKSRQKPKDSLMRHQSMSLPPNIRLNRQNSTHVQATNSNSNSKQKFPWTTKDRTPSEDAEDRLSTISSKEESHSHGSDRRKSGVTGNGNNKKQDSQCQTDNGMFEEYLARSRSDRVGSSLRSRASTGRNSEGAQRCGSDSSINSDEIFLSLPPNNAHERRGMYKTSPIHGDRSPLLNESVTPDKCYGNSLVATLEPYGHTIMSDYQRQDVPPRVKSVSPYNTVYDNAHSNPDHRIECSANTFLHPSPKPLRGSSDPVFQPRFSNGPFLTATVSAPLGSTYQLKPDESSLYGRRHSDNSALIMISNPETVVSNPQRRYTTPNRRPLPQCDQTQTEACEPLLERDSSDLCNSSPVYFSHSDCIRDSRLLPPDRKADYIKLPPEKHVSSSALTPIPAGAPGLNSYRPTSSATSPSPDSTMSTGLGKLEEEEVSMISFHSYLKSRGVDLDMSSVQSSDV